MEVSEVVALVFTRRGRAKSHKQDSSCRWIRESAFRGPLGWMKVWGSLEIQVLLFFRGIYQATGEAVWIAPEFISLDNKISSE